MEKKFPEEIHNIPVKLYKLITSENLEEDYEATQDLFKIEDQGHGVKEGGGDKEEEEEDVDPPEDQKITNIVVPPIFNGLKKYEVAQSMRDDGTITLKVKGEVYNQKEIMKKIEEAQNYLDQVKKVDFSKYTSNYGRKQLEKMKKTSNVYKRRLIEYKNFLIEKCSFYPRRIEIDAGFEGEGIRNSIRKYKPQDFNFADKNFKITLEGAVKLKSKKDNNISLIANKADYIFYINGFKEGIEDVRWRVRNYEA